MREKIGDHMTAVVLDKNWHQFNGNVVGQMKTGGGERSINGERESESLRDAWGLGSEMGRECGWRLILGGESEKGKDKRKS
ncbi:hypothetical protein L484_026911 [Morus notabilis]|uniref:Uncharacterized protein n=1 Tax=Morus notabilis TaxID=981085 RepID=W9R959_9ROSA|nr:hypothetical protein L484_026911 [Morus notabilis]